MSSLTFDTLKLVKKLKESGFNDIQAEALTDIFKESSQERLESLATKDDLSRLETTLKRDMKELELKLTGEITLLKWMMGFVLAGIVSLVLKAFFVR